MTPPVTGRAARTPDAGDRTAIERPASETHVRIRWPFARRAGRGRRAARARRSIRTWTIPTRRRARNCRDGRAAAAPRGARSRATPLAAAGQPVPAGRDPVRGPRRDDPPRIAPDPGRDRRRGPRRPGARGIRRRRRDRRPSDPHVRLDPAQSRRSSRTRHRRSSSMHGTRRGTSCSVGRTSSSGPLAARPS